MSEDKPKFSEGGVIKGPTPTIWPWLEHRGYPGEEILPLSTIERLEEAKKRMADTRIAELEAQVVQMRRENARVLGRVARFREALEEIVATEMEGGWETDAQYIAREALNGE